MTLRLVEKVRRPVWWCGTCGTMSRILLVDDEGGFWCKRHAKGRHIVKERHQ